MSRLKAALVLLPLLIARISAEGKATRILYRWQIPLNNHGIAALNTKTNWTIGYACASTLRTGSFRDEPISILIDQDDPPHRAIKIGAKTFPFDALVQGDPSCSLIYNENLVEVDCVVLRHGSMPPAIEAEEDEDCFSEGYESFDLRAGKKFWDPSRASGNESGSGTMREYWERERAVDRQVWWFWCVTGCLCLGSACLLRSGCF